MQNIKDIMVEIEGERFPAVNIQIWPNSPELEEWNIAEDTYWFGVYFEIMFESGTCLTVSQEAAAHANGGGQTECSVKNDFLNHFLVEAFRLKPQTPDPFYKLHCSDEEELLSVLLILKKNFSTPWAMNFSAPSGMNFDG